MVPTVDLGLRLAAFWSMETAGDSPSIKSTSGLSIWPRNCRAYADRLSTYLRWPSAKVVSKARLDFPEPESPVNTIMASRGRSRETSLRLCSRAPRTTSRSATARPSRRLKGVTIVTRGSDIPPRTRDHQQLSVVGAAVMPDPLAAFPPSGQPPLPAYGTPQASGSHTGSRANYH